MSIPEDKYLQAFSTAGRRILEMAGNIPEPTFRWLKAKPSSPAFADLIFALGSKVYAILIVECGCKMPPEGGNPEVSFSIPGREHELFLDECQANNLIPVIFPIYLDPMEPFSSEWNLFRLPDMNYCSPLEGGIDTTPVPMSKWEMCSFAVQIVSDDLEKKGMKIFSTQDIPVVMPHIWFENEQGKRSWVAVVAGDELDESARNCLQYTLDHIPSEYEGYLARVSASGCGQPPATPMRGEGIYVEYNGLEKLPRKAE